MINTLIQAIVEPKYPRRYVGRHRARGPIKFLMSLSARLSAPD